MDAKINAQKQKLKLEKLKRTIEHFLTEEFDDGTLEKRLKEYEILVNDLEESSLFSVDDIHNHYSKLAEFEVRVAKLIKQTNLSSENKNIHNINFSPTLSSINNFSANVSPTFPNFRVFPNTTQYENGFISTTSNANNLQKHETELKNDDHSILKETTVYYKMAEQNKIKGYCLILNYENFSLSFLSKRFGTEKDAKDLQTLFNKLKFKVEQHNDLSKEETEKALVKVATLECHSEYSCFVLCILSHGKEKEFYCKDGSFSYGNVLEYVNVDSLAGKPKLFFIQACQGNKTDNGILVNSDSVNSNQNHKNWHFDSSSLLPTTADRFIFYSSYASYCSYRSPTYGSLFIQTLVKVFNEDALKCDLSDMCNKVKKLVAEMDGATNNYENIKQMPTEQSTLRKRLRFY